MKKMLILPLLFVACGKDDKKIDSSTPPKVATPIALTGIAESSFWNFSSEKRCDALKSYLKEYSSQVLKQGEVTNFTCQDLTPHGRQSYDAVVEIKSNSGSFISSMSLTKLAFSGSFCEGPYQSDRQSLKCSSELHYENGKMVQGLSEGQDKILPLLKGFVENPQTKSLIYGLVPNDFYAKATNRVSSNRGVVVPYQGNEYTLFFSLTPSDPANKGSLKITKVEPASGYQLFSCDGQECLAKKDFSYELKLHWLIFASDFKLSAIEVPADL